jgi:ADP-ribosyl-[dinitrogen reductase] hydrolase
MPTRQDRIAGGLMGLLVGDALGVPYEFNAPEDLPPTNQIEMQPPTGFRRTYAGVPIGTWSDDGAQALCLLACNKLDPEDLGQRFVQWYKQGYMAVDGKVFDIGIQTRQSIQQLEKGIPALRAGSSEERSQGNGSLMRVLPLALWHQGTDEELVIDAQNQSRVTHGHPVVQVCCALYCLWARRILNEVKNPWKDAVRSLRKIYYSTDPEAMRALNSIQPDAAPRGQGTGYVVDCLHSARLALKQNTYEAVVIAAIALGNDTDTTACVTGGIAGLRDGIQSIPDRWLKQLRGQEIVEPLLKQLIALYNIV